ncbi:unnamed protein product [Vicia faba]|uniref:Uncharacterized protein n=1 Tax=Vicia faba TaxID=3906 RepID=A0AAV0ZI76_VICFA|nr:unnamed protein product [Vicia faba]
MALEKEHYVEALEYNEIIVLLSDAQLLKTMLNDGSGYPKLMKEFMKLRYTSRNVGALSHQLVVDATASLWRDDDMMILKKGYCFQLVFIRSRVILCSLVYSEGCDLKKLCFIP